MLFQMPIQICLLAKTTIAMGAAGRENGNNLRKLAQTGMVSPCCGCSGHGAANWN
jgi:hypothetical protein